VKYCSSSQLFCLYCIDKEDPIGKLNLQLVIEGSWARQANSGRNILPTTQVFQDQLQKYQTVNMTPVYTVQEAKGVFLFTDVVREMILM